MFPDEIVHAILFAEGSLMAEMFNSSSRKLSLSGWLEENRPEAYSISLKLQKFLFLYESFAKASGKPADFTSLKGYKRGPVFSNVYGDYTKHREQFDRLASDVYNSVEMRKKPKNALVDDDIAEVAGFIVDSLTDVELSELTHSFNVWACKKDRIMGGELQVPLDESDFSDGDAELSRNLLSMYSPDLIRNTLIMHIGGKSFVFSKEDAAKIESEHEDILSAAAMDPSLHNPVFVCFDESGGLVFD